MSSLPETAEDADAGLDRTYFGQCAAAPLDGGPRRVVPRGATRGL
jgi:hypothetical protein